MKLQFISGGGGSGGGSGLPYSIFSCQLNFSGGGQPPNHIVLENSLGITMNITRDSTALYTCTLSQALVLSKATFYVGNVWSVLGNVVWCGIKVINSTSFQISPQENNVPIRQDGLFSRTLLEIKQFS